MGKSAKSQRIPSLDLHGKRTDEVEDLVDRFLMKFQGQRRLRIVTGKGSGAVQKKVIAYLKMGSFPWIYEELASGKKNTGVLVLILD